MSRDEGHLFNRKTCFKKTTRAFMTEIVKMKIFDFQVSALTTKSRTH
jgi:hypothetical protein